VTSVVGNLGAFAAINSSGNVIAWGDSEIGGSLYWNVSSTIGSVSTIYHTNRAFAVITSSGGVVAWGSSNFGGSISSSIASELSSDVKLICANDNAFTAIKSDGTAYGWGYSRCELGDSILSGDYSSISSC